MDLLSKLILCVNTANWHELLEHLRPKLFSPSESGKVVDVRLLAKVVELLTSENTPDKVKIVLLKCLGNSCYNNYKHKECSSHEIDCNECCRKLYMSLSNNELQFLNEHGIENPDTSIAYFPFCGVCKWAVNYIILHTKEENECENDAKKEILRLSIQFLCNLFTFACEDNSFTSSQHVAKSLTDANFKSSIVELSKSNHVPIRRVVCMFVHNALKKFPQDYFSLDQKKLLCITLLESTKDGLTCAKEAIFLLFKESYMLQTIYDNLEAEDRLHLINIIYCELSELNVENIDKGLQSILSHDAIEFLSKRFCRRSDLILKTIDTYLDGVEPTEVIVLLDILGTLTSGPAELRTLLQKDKSLLINCIYLLKSLHLAGKQSENYFTPVQKLNEVAPNARCLAQEESTSTTANEKSEIKGKGGGTDDIQSHPAFGFKAGLIRLIGNLSYKNKVNQDLLREEDAIPLLLDCCNIDARNPLIMQWAILALRNLCEGNLQNQEIIANSTKVGVVDTAVIREMGLTLHEEEGGKSIGIMPLIRDQNK